MKVFSNLTLMTRQNYSVLKMTYQYHQRKYISSTSSSVENLNQKDKKRFNAAGVEMLPEWLYKKIFPSSNHFNRQPDPNKINIALKHLELQGLKGKEVEKVLDVPEFNIPELCGNSIAEHFWNIGEHQAKRYRDLALKFTKLDLLNIPEENNWLIEPGWTRYECGKKDPEPVEFPKEQLLCLDVETLLSESNYGLIACAASPSAWYTWISPHLINFRNKQLEFKKDEKYNKDDFKDNDKALGSLRKENDVDNSNFDKNREVGCLIPMGQLAEGRIIVGHNISFDRARIKEEYNYNKSDNKFIDTMSLHIAVSGLCGQQRPSWIRYNRAKKESDDAYLKDEKDFRSIYDISSINNLHDVYKLHCKDEIKIDKSIRKEFFIDGTLEEIVIENNLRSLITYCAIDVFAAFQVFKTVLPRFLKICPHPASFAGMLEMGNMFLTTSKDWDEYVQTAEKAYQIQRDAIETSLQQLADKAVQAGQENQKLIKDDQWLKQLDWSIPSQRVRKLPGFPMWYRDIYCSKQRKVKVTPKSLIAPLLLRLKWQDFPLYYSKHYGWMYRVPKDADYQTNAKACEFSDEMVNSGSSDEESLGQKKLFTKSALLKFINDKDGVYYRIPHKDGEEARCASPLAKHYIASFEKGILSSEHEVARDALQMNASCSYWISSRDRIKKQMVVYEDHPDVTKGMGFEFDNGKTIGMIIPQTVTMGTITRRAVEKTWMTASNAKENRIGSELKAIIQAPKGYKIIGADVDSEELWIASLIGDSQFGFHGATALGWMTLQGNKSAGTDLHSRTANILNISRSDAKVFNYGRIYGAGLKFAVQLLKQFNEMIKDSEAKERATALYCRTKGKKYNDKSREIKKGTFWYGGSESYMFNGLEDIATDKDPTTPVLKCGITDALKEKVVDRSYMTSRVNWVVQSSGVDYLHLLLVSMNYLMEKYKIDGRFMLSVHDEVRFLVNEKDIYRAALALQISNFWTRAMFSYMLGINDLPLSIAFFSAVDIDHVLRKEANTSCKTISYNADIDKGQSLTIHDLLEFEDSQLDKDNEDYNMKIPNSTLKSSTKKLLIPYNNNTTKDKYLEIQSLSGEEEVESCIKNLTKNKTNYANYDRFKGKKNRCKKTYNRSLKRTLIYD